MSFATNMPQIILIVITTWRTITITTYSRSWHPDILTGNILLCFFNFLQMFFLILLVVTNATTRVGKARCGRITIIVEPRGDGGCLCDICIFLLERNGGEIDDSL